MKHVQSPFRLISLGVAFVAFSLCFPGFFTRVAASGPAERLVSMMDACDPETFNAMFGEGTCLRQGGVNLDKFLSLLGQHGFVGAWHFSPSSAPIAAGTTLVAVNRGGEVHTFTEVEEFGGGFIQPLNDLSGNPVPAQECLNLEDDDFVPPGGTYTEQVASNASGTIKVQCCIHPWMRLEARIK